MKHTTLARTGIAGIAILLTLSLAGCRSGATATSGAAGPVGATTTAAIQGGDEFCNIAVASLASADNVNKASNDLSAAMTSNDVNALHSASQAILDNSTEALHFYSLGADIGDTQATKDAFTGLSKFVSSYSVPMGQAGVAAADVPGFMTSITTLFTDPTLRPLLTNVSGWALTVQTFTKQHCAIS